MCACGDDAVSCVDGGRRATRTISITESICLHIHTCNYLFIGLLISSNKTNVVCFLCKWLDSELSIYVIENLDRNIFVSEAIHSVKLEV